MKTLERVTQMTVTQKKDYQYTGNKLVNEIDKPQGKFFIFANDDIENTELSDFEFRILVKLYSLKDGTPVDNKLLAKKFKKTLLTINRTLKSLIQKQYIHISKDKQLIIRRISRKDNPKMIPTHNSLYIKYVQEN